MTDIHQLIFGLLGASLVEKRQRYYSTNKDGLTNVINFQKTYNVTYPILLDRLGEVSKLYKVTSLPTTYIVDDRGKIVEILFGNLNSNELIDKIKNIALNRQRCYRAQFGPINFQQLFENRTRECQQRCVKKADWATDIPFGSITKRESS